MKIFFVVGWALLFNFNSQAATLKCMPVEIGDSASLEVLLLSIHGDRVIRTFGAEVGFYGSGGTTIGSDDRGNPCTLLFGGIDAGGARVGYRTFNVTVQ